MIAALSIIAIAVMGGGRGGGVAGFQTTAPTITTTTVISRRNHRLRRLFSSSFDVNNDWVIEDDDDDDDNNGLGDYPRTITAKSKTTNTRISENRRKRERRKRNEVVDNDDVVQDDVIDDDVRSYFATCIPGLHDTLASELRALGANDVETNGKSGVRFSGSTQIGLLSLLWCRTAHRIMELVASSYYSSQSSSSITTPSNNMDDEFTSGIRNRDDLYQFIRSAVHIPSLLGNGSGGLLTLSVSTIYAGSSIPRDISHSHFTALTVKNAIVDAVREMRDDGSRPDVDVIDSDVPLVLVLRGRNVVDGGEGGRQRRYGKNRNNKSNKFDDRYGVALNKGDEWETVADVDIYRCLHSGGSLHRRGYRRALDNKSSSGSEVNDDDDDDDDDELSSSPIHRAAMKETLAAGLLLEAGWDKLISAAKVDGLGAVLVDPMTGSATLATEAALIACDIAPGLSRIGWIPPSPRLDEQQHRDSGNNNAIIGNDNKHQRPPCTRWKGFDTKGEWHTILIDATKRAKLGMEWARSNNNVRILCNERDVRAVILAKSSIRNTGIDDIVSLNVGDCVNWNLVGANGGVLKGRTIFVCNPPWGLRLTDDIDESWVSLREFLRREAVGCESWVLSGNKDLTKILRMKKSRSVVLKTADEDLRWLQYHIFQKSEVSEYNQSR